MSLLLELQGVQKNLGHRSVLTHADLTLNEGEIVWLAGSNGSGKTTLMKVAAGMTPPSKGVVYWFGQLPSASLRSRLGILLDASFLYGEMTAEENLLYYARLYGLPRANERVSEWLEKVKLHRDRHLLVKAFSKGMKQRLAIARACMHQPTLLFLDEPYDGLDEANSLRLTEWLQNLRRQGTGILLVSHAVAPIRNLPVRTVKLAQGRLVKGESP